MGILERRAENLAAEFSLMIQDWGVCFWEDWEEHWLWQKKLYSHVKYNKIMESNEIFLTVMGLRIYI